MIGQRGGREKKEALDAAARANEGKPAWVANGDRVAGCFSDPAPDPPGSAVRGDYSAVTQPARALSNKRNFICGGGRFWKSPPAGALHGSAKALREAEELLLPKGVQKLRAQQSAIRPRGCAR